MLGNICRKKGSTMAAKRARVSEQWLYSADLPTEKIQLDSAAWFAWLSAGATLSFSYPIFDRRCGYIVGFMTVRKERKQRGNEYWSAYRRQNGRVRKRYLGASRSVTRARLEAIAAAFQSERAAQRVAAEVARTEEEGVQ